MSFNLLILVSRRELGVFQTRSTHLMMITANQYSTLLQNIGPGSIGEWMRISAIFTLQLFMADKNESSRTLERWLIMTLEAVIGWQQTNGEMNFAYLRHEVYNTLSVRALWAVPKHAMISCASAGGELH